MIKDTKNSENKLALYEKLVATNPAVERKGVSMPYTSCNGHMFSFLTKAGPLALRLPIEDREVFLKNYKTALCEQHGRIMKEYVVVPDRLLKNTNDLKKYFEISFIYVSSLKPKATTKKVSKKTAAKKKAANKTAINKQKQ